jgi:arabinofuranosyltransferase
MGVDWKSLRNTALVFGSALAVLVAGWRLMWFINDDAFIMFRYASSSRLGYGYVWNPPPFQPVEGYTSFLWVALLDGVWRWTGVSPPESANNLSLAFAILSLLITTWLVQRLPLSEALRRHRTAVLALVLGGVVSQRTFLTWTTSGMCTAIANFLLLAWFALALEFSRIRSLPRGFALSCASMLFALTRPEGLLFAGATCAMVFAAWFEKRSQSGALRRALLALAPLLGVTLHLAWRLSFYGEWLPNTYYAKHAAAWPEGGARYLLGFILEYSLWFWLAIVLALTPALALRHWRALQATRGRNGWLVGWIGHGAIRDMAVAAVLANVSYYTFVVGGDAFGFRVYSHLIPLLAVALAWLVNRAGLRPAAALTILAAHAVLAWPFAWLHFRLGAAAPPEIAREDVSIPIAPSLPVGLQWYGKLYDETHAWLIDHRLCGRHHGDKLGCLDLQAEYGLRREKQPDFTHDIPVLATTAVGVAGWTLPHVAILDVHGLNDYVVARTPLAPGAKRQMAHDRYADPEYVREFGPNVLPRRNKPGVVIRKRSGPALTPERVREIERRWREHVDDTSRESR